MRQNFEPSIWGPRAWFFLETVCMGYPTDPTYEEKKMAEDFFNSLQFIIPCEKCRNNYKKHLKQHPLTGKVLSSRDNLFMWIINVHNSVHKDRQKTYDDTFKYYMDQYNVSVDEEENKVTGKCSTKSILFYVFMFCVIIAVTYQIYLNM
jgi:hypothetical protein